MTWKRKDDALVVMKSAALLDERVEYQQANPDESDTLTRSKRQIATLDDSVLLADTIAVCNTTSSQMNLAIEYLKECRKRFDNRGKGRGERVIDGYRGWSDFCERGLHRSIRSVQRKLLEAIDPIAYATRREDAKIRARAAKNRLPSESVAVADFKERLNEHVHADRNKPEEREAETVQPEILNVVVEPTANLQEEWITATEPSVTVEQAEAALFRLGPNVDGVKDRWYAQGGCLTKEFPVSEFVETLYASLTIALKAVPVDHLPAVKTELLRWIRDFDYWTKAMKNNKGQGGQHDNAQL